MVLILPEYSQRPYRYGMSLLCIGAMFNWLGLAENNAEPVRYIGVTLIAAGAMLICLAMCFWMKYGHDQSGDTSQGDEPVHHIVTIHAPGGPLEKPPDYDSVTGCLPPCYEDAIRLNPALLLPNNSAVQDVTDSRKLEVDIADTYSQNANDYNNSPAPPYSQACIVNEITNIVPTKNDSLDLVKATTDVAILSNETANSTEDSSQNSDNFGIKVLRLSKRFLRSKRANSIDGECSDNANFSTTNLDVAGSTNFESLPTNLNSYTNTSPSTSDLPVR